MSTVDEAERLRRWRLLLGSEGGGAAARTLSTSDAAMDAALAALYDQPAQPAGRGRAAWAAPRRGSPAGSVTSGRTSRAPSCRSCSATPSTGSA